MISPSFGLTATERVLPNMALDFTTAVLDSRVTFTRSGNTATVVNSSGVIENVNANLPRFDYNPTTLVCQGLLMEDARTNNIVYSEQFDNALWNKTDTTITANSINAPSGTQTADLATEGSAGTSNVAQAIAITSNSTNTFSVFLKRGNTDWIRFVIWDSVANTNRISAWVNLSTGALGATVVNGGTSTGGTASITNFGNGWYRVTLSGAVNNAAVLLNCLFSSAASDGVTTRVNGATFYAWGAQTEAGAFATSYIPTVASTVTRTADVAVMTGTNFSNWYNASQGAFVVESLSCAAVGARFVSVSQTTSGLTADNTIYMDAQANIRGVVFSGSTAVAAMAAGARPARGTLTRASLAYALNNYGVSLNGATPVTDVSGALPVVANNQLEIGQLANGGATTSINSHMRKISFWPQRLINAEVQAFTK